MKVSILILGILIVGGQVLSEAVAYPGTWERIEASGVLRICVDPDNPPYSMGDPARPGFDIEIAQAIAAHLGIRLQLHWNETYFTDRAIRHGLLVQKSCDLFMGLPVGKWADEELTFSRPYYGGAYVLVLRGDEATLTLEALKGTPVGVEVWTRPYRVLFQRGYQVHQYRDPRALLQAIQKGELRAGILWAPTFGWLKRTDPALTVKIADRYHPDPELRTNVAIGIRKEDQDLKVVVDGAVGTLLKDGTIERILAKYGIPFYPPFE